MKTATTLAMSLLLWGTAALAQGAGKVSYSDLSVVMPNAETKDSHKETIEIQSWSLGASNPSGNGTLKIVATSVPPSAARLCQSRTPLPTLTLDADGKRQTFKNVVFETCPAGGATGTFTLTFNGQTTGPLASASLATTSWERPNADLTGLTPAKINGRLLAVNVRGNRAKVLFAMPKTAMLPREASTPSVSEIVVTKIDGTSWSYSGAHALYQDIAIPANAKGSSRIIELTIDFESMKGSRADFVDPDSPIPASR